MNRISFFFFVIGVSCLLLACNPASRENMKSAEDPLPSWNDTPNKTAIIDYVTEVTREGSAGFIPEEDRIATFDNDGTLWAERPVVQMEFMYAQAAKLIRQKPELAGKQPFKAIAEKNTEYLDNMGVEDFIALASVTMADMTTGQLHTEVRNFFAGYTYPGRNCKLTRIRYQPQLELLEYLRQNEFKVFICTGGTVDFVRAFSKDFYGIEPENVIGSNSYYVYKDSAGINDLYLTTKLISMNDKQAKPANILLSIGKRPVLACGNEGGGGDVAMLRYSQGSKYPNLQLLINHDDHVREYEYYEDPDVSLTMAKEHKWNVISIKNDWKTVFSVE